METTPRGVRHPAYASKSQKAEIKQRLFDIITRFPAHFPNKSSVEAVLASITNTKKGRNCRYIFKVDGGHELPSLSIGKLSEEQFNMITNLLRNNLVRAELNPDFVYNHDPEPNVTAPLPLPHLRPGVSEQEPSAHAYSSYSLLYSNMAQILPSSSHPQLPSIYQVQFGAAMDIDGAYDARSLNTDMATRPFEVTSESMMQEWENINMGLQGFFQRMLEAFKEKELENKELKSKVKELEKELAETNIRLAQSERMCMLVKGGSKDK